MCHNSPEKFEPLFLQLAFFKSGSINTDLLLQRTTPEFSSELVLDAKYGGQRLARSRINPEPQL